MGLLSTLGLLPTKAKGQLPATPAVAQAASAKVVTSKGPKDDRVVPAGNTPAKADADERKKLNDRVAKLLPKAKTALARGGSVGEETKRLTREFSFVIKDKGRSGLPAAKMVVEQLETLLNGKGAPTTQQLAERDRLARELKEVVPQVKDLAASKDQRAAEAVRLTKETGGLLSWETLEKAKEKLAALKSLLGGEAGVPDDSPRRVPKSDAEVSLKEFDKDLGGAITNIGKMRKAAKTFGADQLEEHMGKVSEGLSAVKDKAEKLVEIAELARDIQEFQRALEAARSLDLNSDRDYEAAAVAMGDLANIGGKLAKKATGNGVPGLDAYFTLLQNAGAVWEMGARLRKRFEAEADAASRPDSPAVTEQEPSAPRVAKASTAEIPLGEVGTFVQNNLKTVYEEAKSMGGTLINDLADWDLTTDAFLNAFAELKAMHDKRKEITLGPLSAEYRNLGKQMQEPYAEAMKHLQYLQDAVGKRDDLSVTYEPALKAIKKAKP